MKVATYNGNHLDIFSGCWKEYEESSNSKKRFKAHRKRWASKRRRVILARELDREISATV